MSSHAVMGTAAAILRVSCWQCSYALLCIAAGDLCVPYKQGEHSAEGVLIPSPCVGHPQW